uniref:TOG domain-containing protein n=2 Tax=Photinus pyralis TaxID=7054 RepID=A0A1Y1JZU4_PHOPY
MATEDEEWKKLSTEDRCVHKQWKARVSGYEDAAKLFKQIDDEKSPEFSRYLGLIKKFVSDSNAVGQEKGLEAALAYVENYAHAGKTVNDVMSGIVTKCIAAPKTKTRELAMQITLMYVEIEKYEAVQEELIKGMDQKNPKIVAACITAVTAALKEFGSKIVNPKPLIKKIQTLFADRDKSVRDEARLMVVEMFKWIGPALRSQLNNLQPVQVTELEAEFAKVEGQKVTPTRYIRSQQEKQAKLAAETEEAEGDEDVEEEGYSTPTLDPYDIADPVDILSKLPKNFYEQLEAKKWQERKEALELLEKLIKTPKLENGDYGDLIRALKKIIQKDTNVVVIALAAKNLACLANGLKKRFQQYAAFCVPTLLEKFKEKKQNVVLAIREAIDAVYDSITVEVILEDVVEALNSKNPSVKAETASFLSRAFAKTSPTSLNKKLLKTYSAALIKNINEPDPTVRDCSSEALGTLMKLVGEKAIGPFITEIEKDNLKMTKIKECCEKAVISVKVASGKKAASEKSAPPQPKAKEPIPEKTTNAAKPKRPGTATGAQRKKPAAPISSGSATIVKCKSNKAIIEKTRERELGEEEAVELVADILKPETLSGLADSNWKNRLAAVEDFLQQVQAIDASSAPTQALVKVLNKKPGLKDTNFQVLKARLDTLKHIAENCSFSTTSAEICVNDITEKLGDAKNGSLAGDVLLSIAEATKFDFVASLVMDFALVQKSPKVLQESLFWLSNAMKEFGFSNMNAKSLIENAKKALASSNPAVRTAAISLVGTLYLYMGPTLHVFFENEKPALREQINAEFDKYTNEKPPLPVRGLKREKTDVSDQEEEPVQAEEVNIQDLLPRTDISSQISEPLIEQMADKNWKVRNEALTKVSTIISEAKFIKPNIGDLPQALALRLVDSNGKISQTALNICENIATAMGAPCRQYVRVLLPGFLQCLGDSKVWIRTASVACLNSWGDLCAYKEFFDGEMIADALKAGSPTLRSELWTWLAEKLPQIKTVPKEELVACIPHLYSNLEDRNADVRKNAQDAVLGLMIHLSYESMNKQTEKLKPGSKTVVVAALDKARPNLPAKPLPKPKQSSPEDKAVRGTKPVANSKNAVKPKGVATVIKPSSARKKDDDIDTSPLMTINNLKHQRTIDENKLKVLKWNFTTPREEFVELLKEQMLAANINRTLISNMFHIDFRFHIKALESLIEDLPGNGPALISNLDLILKWLTLRFFDTNPAVILKGLEYLFIVFKFLIESKYHMLENEGSAFIPYLVLKAGDPKDTVRNNVKGIFRQLALIFTVSRLFFYVMEGIKSKNARQRTECLDIMGSLIENYGLGVCLPSPAVCLKEVAKQISDRDNAVRNAALNCIVQAYFIVGEKVLKMVGQISDKDMSLLEERIKRAKRPSPKADRTEPQMEYVNKSPQRASMESPVKDVEENGTLEEDDEDDIPVIPTMEKKVQQDMPECTGPFQLDPEIMRELDSCKAPITQVQLQEFDLDFLKEELSVPSLSDARAKAMPVSPPKPILPNETFSRSSIGHLQFSPRPVKDALLEKTIDNMGSSDHNLAFKSIEQMQEILQSNKGSSMIDYENQFMSAIISQLSILQTEDPKTNEEILRIYRSILTVIDTFYVNKLLGRKVSMDVLQNVLNQLIMLLVDAKLEACVNGDMYVRVVNLQCVKIIERSDHTNTICALVKLLHDSVETEAPPRLVDLIMKCLWRVIKLMPSWGDEIDYDSVLYEVHMFLKDFPSIWWKSKPMDTPLRTVKTILHSMVKVKGGQLMLHLGKIPNTNDSELETYILRLLKSMKLEEIKQVPLKTEKTEPKKTLSRHFHTRMTEIFQKIGKKEEAKEGFNLLYDFLHQNPDADLDQFLHKSSHVFQDYISNGLKSIENSRSLSNDVFEKSASSLSGGDAVNVATDDSRGPDYWKDKLQMWNKLWEEPTEKGTSTE